MAGDPQPVDNPFGPPTLAAGDGVVPVENPFGDVSPPAGDASFLGASARAMVPRFVQGLAEGGALVARAGVDVAANQTPNVDDATREELKSALSKPLIKGSQAAGAMADRQFKQLSPEAQATADKTYATLDPSKAAYLDPTRVAGDVVQNLGPILAGLVAPALRARSLVVAGGKAAIEAAARDFATTSALSEGAIGYGQEASQARERVAQAQGTDGTDLLSTKAAERAGAIGAAVDTGSELIGGRVLGKILAEGGGIVRRAVTGFADQALTEGVQGAGEQLGENEAVRTTINPKQDLLQDVTENAVSSAVVGGATGGAVAAVLGSSGHERGLNPDQATGDAEPAAAPAERPPIIPTEPVGQQRGLFTVDDMLDRGIAPVETGGQEGAVSEAGALGRYQLEPRTAQETAKRLGLKYDPEKLRTDDAYNRTLAKAHLQELLQKYDGDQLLAITAYNAGQGNVDSWVKRFGYDPSNPQAFLQQIAKVGNPRSASYPIKVLASMGQTLDAAQAAPAPVDTTPDLDTLADKSTISKLLRGAAMTDDGKPLPYDTKVAALSTKLSMALGNADIERATKALDDEHDKIEKAANKLADQQTELTAARGEHTDDEHSKYQAELDDKLEQLIHHAAIVKAGHDLVQTFAEKANTTQPSLFPAAPAQAAAPAAPAAPAVPAAPVVPVHTVTEPDTAAFGRRPTLPAEPQPRVPTDASQTELAAGLKTEAANTVSAHEQARAGLLDRVLGDPNTRRPTQRFVAELKRRGMPSDITGAEAERIGRYEAARDAFTDPNQPDHFTEPSAPDESDNFGIAERQPAAPAAPTATPVAETPQEAPTPAPEAAAAVEGNIRTRAETKADTLGSSRRAWFLRGVDAEMGAADTPEPRSKSISTWFNEGRAFVREERAHQEREAQAKDAAARKATRSQQIRDGLAKRKAQAQPRPEAAKPAPAEKTEQPSRGTRAAFDTAVAAAEQKGDITSKEGVALRAAAEAAWDQSMWGALDQAVADGKPAARKFMRFEPSQQLDTSKMDPDKLVKVWGEVEKWLRRELDKVGLKDVDLSVGNLVMHTLRVGREGGTGTFAGRYSPAAISDTMPLIEVAFDFRNPLKILHHEAIHAMRDLNLFKEQEWSKLVDFARKQREIMGWTAKAYAELPRWQQDEEAVAETFAQWMNNRKTVPARETLVSQTLRKMQNLLDAISLALHRVGLTNASAVMQLIERGEIGARERGESRSDRAVREGGYRENLQRQRVATFPEPVEKANKAVGHTVAEFAKKGHIWLSFTEDLANMAKKFLPSATQLVELHSKNFALSRQFEERLLQIKEAYEKLPAAIKGTAKGSISEFLYDSRMKGQWGFMPDYMPKAVVDKELAQRFNRMPPAAQDVVKAVFRFNYDARNQLYKATVGAIDAEYDPLIAAASDPDKAAEISAEKDRAMAHFSRVFDTREGVPYTPLKREGMWVVVGRSNEYAQAKRDDDVKKMDELRSQEDHYFVDFRDTVAEAEALRDRVATKFGRQNTSAFERSGIPDGEIGGPELYIAFQQLKEAVEGQVNDNPASKAAKELHRLATDLYLHTLSDTSARKGELRADLVPARDPVTGEVTDMMRAFVTRGQATTHYVASISNNAEVQSALRALREELSQTEGDDRKPAARFYNQLLYRYTENLGARPNRFVDRATRAVSFYNLLTSPMYYAQNATQAVLLSQPLLAGRVGYAKAGAAFAQAYADFAKMTEKTSVMDRVDFSRAPEDVRDVLKRLADRGRLDAGLSHELGSWQVNGDGVLPKTWNTVDRFFRQVPQRVEVMNRVVTGIAAYRTMLAKTKDPQAAFDYASTLIYDSHGDYSGFNAPTPFHALKGFGKIALQFRKFQMIMGSMLVKEFHKSFAAGSTKNERNAARVGLLFTAAHMAAIGGIVGMPAASALGWAIGQALKLTDPDRKDEYHDWQEDLRTWLGAGKDGEDRNLVADMLFKGAPYALLHTDLSGKLGLGTVLSPAPYTDADKALDSKDAFYQALGQVLSGALGGIAAKAVDGWSYAQVGDIGRTAELWSPQGVTNLMKAHRLATQGVTNRQGDTMTSPEDISLLDEAMTMVGLTPRKLGDQSQHRSQVFQADEHYNSQTTVLKRRYLLADDDGKDKVRDEWNALQDARERQGFKRQPLADLMRSQGSQLRREARTVDGVQTTPSDRMFVLDMLDQLDDQK